jgi:hypothetical protein
MSHPWLEHMQRQDLSDDAMAVCRELTTRLCINPDYITANIAAMAGRLELDYRHVRNIMVWLERQGFIRRLDCAETKTPMYCLEMPKAEKTPLVRTFPEGNHSRAYVR